MGLHFSFTPKTIPFEKVRTVTNANMVYQLIRLGVLILATRGLQKRLQPRLEYQSFRATIGLTKTSPQTIKVLQNRVGILGNRKVRKAFVKIILSKFKTLPALSEVGESEWLLFRRVVFGLLPKRMGKNLLYGDE